MFSVEVLGNFNPLIAWPGTPACLLKILPGYISIVWPPTKAVSSTSNTSEPLNAKLSIAATTNQQTIDKLTSDFQQQQELNSELNIKLKASEAYGDNLAKKLREHDLTMLTLKKPGLIERRVNSATQKILTDLESSTATVN